MTKENIILFIPMDTSNLDQLPNFQDVQQINELPKKQIKPMKYNPEINFDDNPSDVDNLPGFDLLNPSIENNVSNFQMEQPNNMQYNQEVHADPSLTNLNKKDLEYNPIIDDIKEPFNFQNQSDKEKDYNFDDVFIQFRECNKRLEWPIFTDIHCKQDCHPFTNRPWYLPSDYIDGVFIVLPHVFCSPNCALGWLKETGIKIYGLSEYSKINSLFYLMLRIITQTKNVTVQPSPEQDTLKILGGAHSIDQFRQHHIKIGPEIKLEYPEILVNVPIIKQIKQKQTNKDENVNRLKRIKPNPKKTRTIFDTLVKKVPNNV